MVIKFLGAESETQRRLLSVWRLASEEAEARSIPAALCSGALCSGLVHCSRWCTTEVLV